MQIKLLKMLISAWFKNKTADEILCHKVYLLTRPGGEGCFIIDWLISFDNHEFFHYLQMNTHTFADLELIKAGNKTSLY